MENKKDDDTTQQGGQPIKIPLGFDQAIEGLLGVKWEKTGGEGQAMNELTAGEMTKEVYDKLKAFRKVFDYCDVLRPVLWELEMPSLGKPPTGPGGSANVKMKRLPVPNETDKWSMLRHSIQELRAIYDALMEAGHLDMANRFSEDANKLDEAANRVPK